MTQYQLQNIVGIYCCHYGISVVLVILFIVDGNAIPSGIDSAFNMFIILVNIALEGVYNDKGSGGK